MSALAARTTYNLGQVERWTPERWAEWYFTVLREDRTEPLLLDPNVDAVTEIDQLFTAAGEHTRAVMKQGLVLAIREWTERRYGLVVLQRLTYLASKLRASTAVPHLIELLRRNRRSFSTTSDSFFQAADMIVAVLAGFGADEQVERAFHAMFFDDSVTPRLASLLAIGICICNPTRFGECFNRFMILRERAPHYFDDRRVILQFSRAMTPGGISEALHELTETAQEYLLERGAALGISPIPSSKYMGFDTGARDMRDARSEPAPINPRNSAAELKIRYNAAVRRVRTLGKTEGTRSTTSAILKMIGSDRPAEARP